MSATKAVLIGGGVLAAGLLARAAMNLQALNANLVIDTSLRIHRVSLAGLGIAADVTLKNPSNGTLSVSHPSVLMFSSEKNRDANAPFASSDPSGKTYQIPRQGIVRLDPIEILLPIAAAPGLVMAYLRGELFNIHVRKITRINNLADKQFDEVITLKKAPEGVSGLENVSIDAYGNIRDNRVPGAYVDPNGQLRNFAGPAKLSYLNF